MKRAEIAAYFSNFDEAEKIYLEMDRKYVFAKKTSVSMLLLPVQMQSLALSHVFSDSYTEQWIVRRLFASQPMFIYIHTVSMLE